jgi:hypothetical protein
MCKDSRHLGARLFGRALSFEEGDKWGPVLSREKTQIALRVSDSERRFLVWLTRFGQMGSDRNPCRKCLGFFLEILPIRTIIEPCVKRMGELPKLEGRTR